MERAGVTKLSSKLHMHAIVHEHPSSYLIHNNNNNNGDDWHAGPRLVHLHLIFKLVASSSRNWFIVRRTVSPPSARLRCQSTGIQKMKHLALKSLSPL